MILTIILLIHLLIGYIGYILCRKTYIKGFNGWTIRERWYYLSIGIIPIINIYMLVAGLYMYIDSHYISDKENKPSK